MFFDFRIRQRGPDLFLFRRETTNGTVIATGSTIIAVHFAVLVCSGGDTVSGVSTVRALFS